MRNIRGLFDDLITAIREDQALMAAVGATGGVVLAVVLERAGGDVDPESFTVTVDQARTSLLSSLALVFTGLSIVLALTALTTQNMANKFSPRLLRMKLRGSGNKSMLAVFALTASFIISSQILLRTRPGDSLAPEPTMAASVALLVITGVVIIWYINGTIQSLRVDRTIAWIGHHIVQAADAHQRSCRNDEVVEEPDIDRPDGATDLIAAASGYLVDVDTECLSRLATSNRASITIDKGTGHAIVRGEPVGWLATTAPLTEQDLAAVANCLAVAEARDPDNDVAYTISVLVDVTLMALSPAVNDPHTAVESIEMLTAVFVELAERPLGTRVRRDADGTPVVTVREQSVAELLDTVGRQILLYGQEDRSVTASLLWFAREGGRVMTVDRDRDLAKALADDIEATRAQAGG